MQHSAFLAFLATVLPVAYGAPSGVANGLVPVVLDAMKRDLGLEAHEANARVTQDVALSEKVEEIKTLTSSGFAGAWIDGGALKVAVTDEAMAAKVEAAGATPVTVVNSLSKLQDAKAALDNKDISKAKRSIADSGIAAYYVDVTTNKLVIEALADSTAHAEAMATSVGLSTSEYTIKTVESMPTTFATVYGGDAYYIDNLYRCSVGFAVTTGFVSAGHCGSVGSSAMTTTGASLGTFSGSVFPGSADMSYVKTVTGTTLSYLVDLYTGYGQPITGSTVTATGGSICRSGSTSGVHCGTVQALGATVTYAEGRVTGLTQTNVCAEAGDSGGSFYTTAQAQGVTSGGSGDCTSGGTTYFQPVGEILSTYGLTLKTS
ncbi:peptidase alpha-lytic pro domain protein [Xylaria arbuscula]|nr:peptidase alpha-lytic pro domain protein [Xylaria arbuscula]